MSLRNILHPSWTMMYGETDGYDACAYADTDPYGGNIMLSPLRRERKQRVFQQPGRGRGGWPEAQDRARQPCVP